MTELLEQELPAQAVEEEGYDVEFDVLLFSLLLLLLATAIGLELSVAEVVGAVEAVVEVDAGKDGVGGRVEADRETAAGGGGCKGREAAGASDIPTALPVDDGSGTPSVANTFVPV